MQTTDASPHLTYGHQQLRSNQEGKQSDPLSKGSFNENDGNEVFEKKQLAAEDSHEHRQIEFEIPPQFLISFFRIFSRSFGLSMGSHTIINGCTSAMVNMEENLYATA